MVCYNFLLHSANYKTSTSDGEISPSFSDKIMVKERQKNMLSYGDVEMNAN